VGVGLFKSWTNRKGASDVGRRIVPATACRLFLDGTPRSPTRTAVCAPGGTTVAD